MKYMELTHEEKGQIEDYGYIVDSFNHNYGGQCVEISKDGDMLVVYHHVIANLVQRDPVIAKLGPQWVEMEHNAVGMKFDDQETLKCVISDFMRYVDSNYHKLLQDMAQ